MTYMAKISKPLQGGTIINVFYNRDLTEYSSMLQVTPLAWSLTSAFPRYDPNRRCTQWNLKDSGAVAAELDGIAEYVPLVVPQIEHL